MHALLGSASLDSLLDSVNELVGSLASVNFGLLFLGLLVFGIYLTIRSRALFNILSAAYPHTAFQWRRVWGAYFAAYGANNVLPGGAGNIVSLFLIKKSISGSSYPTVAACFLAEAVFDCVMAALVLSFAFLQNVFPRPSEFSDLGAFDLSFFAGHPEFTAFVVTAAVVAVLAAFAVLSVRIRAFWQRVRQGLTVLFDVRNYVRKVFLVQLFGWFFRLSAFWLMLSAFGVGGSVRGVLFVLAAQIVAALMPVTPGGAGVQQALVLAAFAGSADETAVAAYSIGQEIAIAAFTLGIGFLALVTIFRVRSFREVIRQGRREKASEASGADGSRRPASSG
jgi:uncharacterized membrane protein YbhN (UPF0104 family)